MSTKVDFQYDARLSGILPDELDIDTSGLGPVLHYDSRDNIFSPNSGQLAKLEAMVYNEALGGDFNYTKIKAASYS
jgi:outer membrane protein assembly factor BamA